jgi:signal peptidase I
MRAASLDRRVRKEATMLVREARAALGVKKGLRGKAGDLETATTDVERGLAAKDLGVVRRGLPTLDSLVDELIKRPSKSTTRDYIESIGAAILIALALRAFVVEAFKIPSSSMYPTLEIGDHIFVNKFLYGLRIPWTDTKLFELREPRRGEVIVFKMPCEPERDYIKRVVALAGDTVEVRCNVVHVNGKAIQSTLVTDQLAYEDNQGEDASSHAPESKPDPDGWYPRSVSAYRETLEDGSEYVVYDSVQRPTWEAQRRQNLHVPTNDKDFPSEFLRSCANPASPASPTNIPAQKPGKLETTGAPSADECKPFRHYVVPEHHVFVMGDNRANSNDSRFWGSVPMQNIKGKALFIWLSYRDWSPTQWGGLRWGRIGNFVD